MNYQLLQISESVTRYCITCLIAGIIIGLCIGANRRIQYRRRAKQEMQDMKAVLKEVHEAALENVDAANVLIKQYDAVCNASTTGKEDSPAA